jgi:hypothetical protein
MQRARMVRPDSMVLRMPKGIDVSVVGVVSDDTSDGDKMNRVVTYRESCDGNGGL